MTHDLVAETRDLAACLDEQRAAHRKACIEVIERYTPALPADTVFRIRHPDYARKQRRWELAGGGAIVAGLCAFILAPCLVIMAAPNCGWQLCLWLACLPCFKLALDFEVKVGVAIPKDFLFAPHLCGDIPDWVTSEQIEFRCIDAVVQHYGTLIAALEAMSSE